VDVRGLTDLVRQRGGYFFFSFLEKALDLEHFGVDDVDILRLIVLNQALRWSLLALIFSNLKFMLHLFLQELLGEIYPI